MSKSSAYAETLHIMTSRKGNATRLRWFCEMCYESMDIEPLKLLLKTLEIIWKFPWKKNHGLKFKFENPWNKCRCLNRKKFKGLVYQRPNAESLFINHEDLRKFRGDLTLENPRGYNSRSKSISEEKETVNLHFSTMKKKTQGLFRICTKSDLWKKYSGAWIQGWNETFYPYLAEIQGWKEPSDFLVPYRNLNYKA